MTPKNEPNLLAPRGGDQGASPQGEGTHTPEHAAPWRAGARPWHLEVGWDGGLTAVVDVEGHLIADCEPQDPSRTLAEHGAAGANARLIVAAVNAYRGEGR